MKGFIVKNFMPHQVVFQEGDRGEHAYLLTEGKIEISSKIEGRKKVLAVLTPVTVFGEMAVFLEGQRRTATAMTLTEAKLVVISKENFDQYVEQSPQVIASVIGVLVSRLRTATKKSLKVPNVYNSLAQFFYLLERSGASQVPLDELVSVMTCVFVANKEEILTKLKRLASEGYLELKSADGRKVVAVKDSAKLSELSKSCMFVQAELG